MALFYETLYSKTKPGGGKWFTSVPLYIIDDLVFGLIPKF